MVFETLKRLSDGRYEYVVEPQILSTRLFRPSSLAVHC